MSKVVNEVAPRCKISSMKGLAGKSVRILYDLSYIMHKKAYAIQQRRKSNMAKPNMNSVEWSDDDVSKLVDYCISEIYSSTSIIANITREPVSVLVVSDGTPSDDKMRCSNGTCVIESLDHIKRLLSEKKRIDPVLMVDALFRYHGQADWMTVARSLVRKYCKKVTLDMFKHYEATMSDEECDIIAKDFYVKFFPNTARVADYIGTRCSGYEWDFIAAEGEADSEIAMQAWATLKCGAVTPIIYARDADYFMIGCGLYLADIKKMECYNLETFWRMCVGYYHIDVESKDVVHSIFTHVSHLNNDYTMGTPRIGPVTVSNYIMDGEVNVNIPPEWLHEWGPLIRYRSDHHDTA